MDDSAKRDSRGRFSGVRVDVESVPRLPTFPASWVLNDPRRRSYCLFWAERRTGQSIAYSIRMSRGEEADTVIVTHPGGRTVSIAILRRPLPNGSGHAILYRCPGCRRLRRYLYLLSLVGGRSVDSSPPQCLTCAGLRYVTQGHYRSVLDRTLRLQSRGGRRVHDPYPRHPWDPRAVSDPRLVADEFQNIGEAQ